MSHFHFVLLDNYKKRLKRLGEESWRIKVIGMPSLNKKNILKIRLKKYKIILTNSQNQIHLCF